MKEVHPHLDMFQYNGICALLEYKICSKVGVIITFPDGEVLRI